MEHLLTIDQAPKSRCISWLSRFSHPKSNHVSLVHEHHFTQRVRVAFLTWFNSELEVHASSCMNPPTISLSFVIDASAFSLI